MKVIKTQEFDNINYCGKKYYMDNSVQIESFVSILKEFETDEIKFAVCHCNTFDSDGSPLYYRCHEIDEVYKLLDAPSPYVKFSADYCKRQNSSYCFSLLASVNSDVVRYVVDKKKLGDEISFRFKMRY